MTNPLISSEEQRHILDAARQTWDEIGDDCLGLLKEEGQSPVMPRSHVIEVVLDADRLKTRLQHAKEWTATMETLSYSQWQHIVRKAFPFARYGF